MNFLFQGYACSAIKGGEYAISYGWLAHLDAAVREEDTIYIVSLTFTESDLEKSNLKHVKILNIIGMEKWNFLHYNSLYYSIWQKKAYRAVVDSGIKFDFIHAFSLSNFRQPGYWYKLRDSYTVLGPVGGGQECPTALRYYDGKLGSFRNIINRICKINPLYKKKISDYSCLYACNYETQVYMPNSKLLVDVPLNDRLKNLKIENHDNNCVILLCCGRLINKKGFLFLLDCLNKVNPNLNWMLHIYGDGNQRNMIKKRILELELENKVVLKGNVPYETISEAYRSGDVFILPSLRESGGSVLVEAMAHKLPIVSLKIGLSRILERKKTGLFVEVNQDKDSIIYNFARNIESLIINPKLRKELGSNGYNYVNNELTWDNIMREVYGQHISI